MKTLFVLAFAATTLVAAPVAAARSNNANVVSASYRLFDPSGAVIAFDFDELQGFIDNDPLAVSSVFNPATLGQAPGALTGSGFSWAGEGAVKTSASATSETAQGAAGGNATAFWEATVVAGGSGIAAVSGVFQRGLAILDPLTLGERGDAFLAAYNSNPVTLQAGGNVISLFSQANFGISVIELGTGRQWGIEYIDTITRQMNIVIGSNGVASINYTDGDIAVAQILRQSAAIDDGDPNFFYSLATRATTPVSFPAGTGFGFDAVDSVTFDAAFTEGASYRITMQSVCGASVHFGNPVLVQPIETFAARCNAADSGYWAGLSRFRAVGGGSAPAFSLTGASFDLASTSPILPPDLVPPPAVVPEPASWALLIAGFGLTGAVMRRHRIRIA